MYLRVITVAFILSASPAFAEPLSFNGLTGKSTMAVVKARFPAAKSGSLCKPGEKTGRFADGVSRCEYLSINRYELAGYPFHVAFFFAESGGIKSIGLTWPWVDDAAAPSDLQIENAYHSLIDLYVGKYGSYVNKPPCSYFGGHCQEWQMDGNREWHAGGERISLEYEAKLKYSRGVSIKYTFADLTAFNRF